MKFQATENARIVFTALFCRNASGVEEGTHLRADVSDFLFSWLNSCVCIYFGLQPIEMIPHLVSRLTRNRIKLLPSSPASSSFSSFSPPSFSSSSPSSSYYYSFIYASVRTCCWDIAYTSLEVLWPSVSMTFKVSDLSGHK